MRACDDYRDFVLQNNAKLIHALLALTSNVRVAEEVAAYSFAAVFTIYAECDMPYIDLFRIAIVEVKRGDRKRFPAHEKQPAANVDDGEKTLDLASESGLSDQSETSDLFNELQLLPTRQREVVVLSALSGLETVEIAQILGIDSAAVDGHRERGLSRLSTDAVGSLLTRPEAVEQ